MNEKVKLVVAVVVTVCLMSALFAFRAYGGWAYDPWWDVNDDGKIDIGDLARVSGAFGTFGQNITKAFAEYDSGWLDISDKQGQSLEVTHNLNISTWNSQDLIVDVMGKSTMEGELLRGACQYQVRAFDKVLGGTNDDVASSIVQTNDDGYALAGGTISYGSGGWDAWLVKTDAHGNAEWNQTYGGPNYDEAWALVQTNDGGYAIAGSTDSSGSGSTDFWLVKTDALGNHQWNKTYGGTGIDVAYALVETSDGGYALAGYTRSFKAGGSDMWLVKTNSNGDEEWNRTYAGIYSYLAHALVQTNDGGYALAGKTDGGGGSDFFLVKTDSLGNETWSKNYIANHSAEAYDLVQSSDGGYALAGYAYDSVSSYDSWLVKTDADGNALWNRTYGGMGAEVAWAIVQTSDEGYALAGYTSSVGGLGYWDVWLVKTDKTGRMRWTSTYGGEKSEEARDLVMTRDGAFALAGWTKSYGTGDYDAALFKTGGELGLSWLGSASETITLYRAAADTYWNYVRVRIWKIHNP